MQENGKNTQKVTLIDDTDSNCHLTAAYDGSLQDPLQLHFTDTGGSKAKRNKNGVQGKPASENTSALYSQHISTNLGSDNSSDNFVAGNGT